MRSVEFALGLFTHAGRAGIAAEDLDGPHGNVLRVWQKRGIISREPGMHPCPSCPHCENGVPYRLDGRVLCNACASVLDPRTLFLWPLHRETFLTALAKHLHLSGGHRNVDDTLWQIGTGRDESGAIESFFAFNASLSDQAEQKIASYRRVLVFHGPSVLPDRSQHARWMPLLLLFRPDGSFADETLATLLRPRGTVRFDAHTGALWIADTWLGEVRVGSREFHLLACLAEQLDQFVPYTDLKREVLRRSGSRDETDEASFCHGLKRRIKQKWIAGIDRLVVKTNKGDGYRLRAWLTEV